MEDLAVAVRCALDSSDLDRFGHLLAPDVRWGAPDDPKPPCQSRRDVIRWYERGKEQGRRARVLDVAIHGDRLVVHLRVRDESGLVPDDEQDRWQVLTCADGRVVDIRGYETAERALSRVTDG
ncbi:MAG: nuclear transport factor 2 family protein [Acidobacteriota bacterium]|nr:nuclear transport factor 2 family protein [Acidobacteriota bacterium]